MIEKWQITDAETDEGLRHHRLFIDGNTQDLDLAREKLAPIIFSVKKAGAPYSYCLFINELQPKELETVKNIMGLLSKITQTEGKKESSETAAPPDFLIKFQNIFLGLASKIQDKNSAGEHFGQQPQGSAMPEAYGPEIGLVSSWQTWNSKTEKLKTEKTAGFFEQVESQLLTLDKIKSAGAAADKTTGEKKNFSADKIIFENKVPQKQSGLDQFEISLEGDFTAQENKMPIEAAARVLPADAAVKSQEISVEFGGGKTEPTKTPSDSGGVHIDIPQRFKFDRRKHMRFSISCPENPLQTVDSFLLDASNRQAYSNIASLIENPVEQMSPALIWGPASCGKTHIANGTVLKLKEKLGQPAVLYTSGLRLSKAVERARKEKKYSEFISEMTAFNSAVIDDIHTLALTAEVKAFFGEFFETYKKNKKQIFITSRFSSKKLNEIFEDWSFSLPVKSEFQIKAPSDELAENIAREQAENLGFELSKEAAKMLLKGEERLASAVKNLSRIAVLRRVIDDFPQDMSKAMELIAPQNRASFPELPPQELGKAALFRLPEENLWGRWGLFYHKGDENYGKYVLYALHKKAEELGIKGGWENVFMQPYDKPDCEIFPSQMAYYAFEKNARATIILGPAETHPFYDFTDDFFSMLGNAFSSIGLYCGCISRTELADASSYPRLIADMFS